MSSQGIHKARPARPLAALAAAAVAAASVFLATLPVSAHDELLSSDPAADSTVDALPAELTLTFSGVLTGDDGASVVEVTDAGGTSLVAGPPVVADTVLTQPLAGDESGAVRVLWKVVSSDGHPISGQFAFTVAGAPAPTPTSEPSEGASPTAPADDAGSGSSDAWPWVIGGILLAAVVGAVVYLLTSRARRDRALGVSRAAGAQAPPEPGSEPPADR